MVTFIVLSIYGLSIYGLYKCVHGFMFPRKHKSIENTEYHPKFDFENEKDDTPA